MKNAIICLCALLLAVGLFFVLFVPSEPGQQLIPGLASSDPRDRTVLPEFSYNPETIEGGTILEMVSFHGSVPEFDPVARKADACIEGRVENIYYTFSGGIAWTRYCLGLLSRGLRFRRGLFGIFRQCLRLVRLLSVLPPGCGRASSPRAGSYILPGSEEQRLFPACGCLRDILRINREESLPGLFFSFPNDF